MDLLCFCSVLCLLCLCARLFICALWSPAGKGLTSWLGDDALIWGLSCKPIMYMSCSTSEFRVRLAS